MSATSGFELEGRRALVTGAGQGVGEGVARELAAHGVEVAVNDYFADRAQAVVDSIVAGGGAAVSLPFDVTDHAQVSEAIAGVGGVDILVNNAGNAGTGGFGQLVPFAETSPEDWATYFDVNLYGVLNCTHAALPGMIDRGWGRVLTVISDAGRIGEAYMAPYAAAKAGAAGFCRAVAREVSRHGITVNNLSLGTMKTPLTAALYDDPANADQVKALLSSYLVRRPGDPSDVAWIVAMLASPRASWVTGQTIPVNGGFSFAL
jgi:NAD(P)-dependent dehydrogenase (short-subunit alcohol dehydrogenase family)